MSRHGLLYVYEGCTKHGCKIGVSNRRSLDWRLAGVRQRCRAANKFARTWDLSNAYQIEQCVIGILSTSDRNAPPGEEWFHVSVEEMVNAVGFAMEVLDPNPDRPRRYRMLCGHVTAVET